MESKPVIRQLFDHETYTFTYLVFDAETKEGVIIDPVKEQIDRDFLLIEELGIELKYVLDTHVHADHITSSGIIKSKTGAEILLGSGSKLNTADRLLQDGEEIKVGGFFIEAIATPGHTNGCTSYKVSGAIFSGDTLFIRGCGRTDFQQGSADTLFESVHQKIYTLPDDTIIFPGHDYKGHSCSSVGEEKKYNPRLKLENSKETFVEIMKNLKLAHPRKIQEALPANQKLGLESGAETEFYPKMNMSDLYQNYLSITPDYDLIVDVRSQKEFEEAHVPGSINIPMGEELKHIDRLKDQHSVYLYCRSGRRSQTVFSNLREKGLSNLKCINTSGMQDWIQSGYPIEKL